jgi:hypothetical protein
MALSRHWTLALGLAWLTFACNGGDEGDDTTTDTGTTDDDDTTTGDGDTTTGDGDTTDDDVDTTADTTGDGDTTGDDTTDTGNIVEFAAIHQILMDQGCTAGYCHGGGQGGLMMTDAATSYSNLVDADATMQLCGLQKRVVPGDPESSIMWMRVRPIAMDGGMPCAAKMPQGSEGLPEAEAQMVFDWIANGAQP